VEMIFKENNAMSEPYLSSWISILSFYFPNYSVWIS